MSRAYAPLLAPFGLTYVQYLVLLVLWEGEALSVGALGDRLFLNSATLTPVLKRMERAGLVTRRRGVADEREVHLALTAAGRKLEVAMRSVPEAILCKTALAPAALVALRAKLRTLHRHLVDEAEPSPLRSRR
ncbi:MAG: MarR family transcriptional regulator [Vulcanimicrobiaceae bacterium]